MKVLIHHFMFSQVKFFSGLRNSQRIVKRNFQFFILFDAAFFNDFPFKSKALLLEKISVSKLRKLRHLRFSIVPNHK